MRGYAATSSSRRHGVASDEIPPGGVVPDERPGGAGSELGLREQDTVVLVSPGGSALVVGADERVNRLVAEAGRPGSAVPLSRLSGGRLADVAAALGTVTGLLGTHGAYFELSADSVKKLRAGGQLMDAGGGWVRGVIRGGGGTVHRSRRVSASRAGADAGAQRAVGRDDAGVDGRDRERGARDTGVGR